MQQAGERLLVFFFSALFADTVPNCQSLNLFIYTLRERKCISMVANNASKPAAVPDEDDELDLWNGQFYILKRGSR
jgi:hypothetical protein